jgi:methanethiol S-methyltransferase
MYWISFLCWLGFGLLHSLLASTRFQAFLPQGKRYFRLAYNLFNLALFAALCFGLYQQPGANLWQSNNFTTGGSILCLLSGSLLAIAAFRNSDGAEFIGIRHLQNDAPTPPGTLVTTGLNAWVRHPLYSATMLLLIGICLCWPFKNIIFAAIGLTVYLPMGIYWEEIKLRNNYGEAYRRYQQQVKRLIPGIW